MHDNRMQTKCNILIYMQFSWYLSMSASIFIQSFAIFYRYKKEPRDKSQGSSGIGRSRPVSRPYSNKKQSSFCLKPVRYQRPQSHCLLAWSRIVAHLRAQITSSGGLCWCTWRTAWPLAWWSRAARHAHSRRYRPVVASKPHYGSGCTGCMPLRGSHAVQRLPRKW